MKRPAAAQTTTRPGKRPPSAKDKKDQGSKTLKSFVEVKEWQGTYKEDGWDGRLIGLQWKAGQQGVAPRVEERWLWTPPGNSNGNDDIGGTGGKDGAGKGPKKDDKGPKKATGGTGGKGPKKNDRDG